MTTRFEPPLLEEALPELAAELRNGIDALLRVAADPEERQLLESVIKQLGEIRIRAACGCGDDFCASFYTGPQPRRGEAWGPTHQSVALEEYDHVLDVVDGRICYVEVLYHPTVKAKVDALFERPAGT